MKLKVLVIIIAVIFLLSAGGSLYILFSQPSGMVRIVSDGEVVEVFNPKTSQDREIVVEYEGRTNTVTIKDGEVFVSKAECPDHTCMRMGTLRGAAPIVCLPNRLVIEYVGADTVDAITR